MIFFSPPWAFFCEVSKNLTRSTYFLSACAFFCVSMCAPQTVTIIIVAAA